MILSLQTRISGPHGPLTIRCSHPPPHYQHHHWQYHLQLQVFVSPLCKIFVPPYMIYLFIYLLIHLFIYLIIYTIYLDTPRVVGDPLQGASGRWNWCTLKCFCTYRLFKEYLWYFFHKCYSGIAYIYTFLAFLYGKSIVIFHRNKSFHSTVDAVGVCIWSKKQKPIFGGVMASFAECLGCLV